MRAALVRTTAGEHVEAALGDRVRRLDAVAADVRGIAADVDDDTATGVAHRRHGHPAQVPGARQVHPQDVVPGGRVVVENAAEYVHGGVVDQDLHRAEGARHLGDDCVDLVAVTGVHRIPDHGGARVVGGDRGGDRVGPPFVDVGDDDPGTTGGQPPGRRLADALPGRGRHQGDPSAELRCHERLRCSGRTAHLVPEVIDKITDFFLDGRGRTGLTWPVAE